MVRQHVIIHELLPFKGRFSFDKGEQNKHISSHTLVSELSEEEKQQPDTAVEVMSPEHTPDPSTSETDLLLTGCVPQLHVKVELILMRLFYSRWYASKHVITREDSGLAAHFSSSSTAAFHELFCKLPSKTSPFNTDLQQWEKIISGQMVLLSHPHPRVCSAAPSDNSTSRVSGAEIKLMDL